MGAASRLTIINETARCRPTHRKACRIALRLRFAPNRCLADLERIGHDCCLGEAAIQQIQKALTVGEPERHQWLAHGHLLHASSNNRSLRTGLAIVSSHVPASELPVATAIRAAETAINTGYDQTNKQT